MNIGRITPQIVAIKQVNDVLKNIVSNLGGHPIFVFGIGVMFLAFLTFLSFLPYNCVLPYAIFPPRTPLAVA